MPVSPLCNSDKTSGWHSANEIVRRAQTEKDRVGGACAWNPGSEDQKEFVPWLDLTRGESGGQDEKNSGSVPPATGCCVNLSFSPESIVCRFILRKGKLIRRSNSLHLAIDNVCFLFTIRLAQE